jgi:trk system potassium uptake protein TrkH
MRLIDALFTATSATCVTGLIVEDTGTYFTTFGQVVILVLIQMGGLGIMTFSTLFTLLLGRRITLADSAVVQDSVAHIDRSNLGGVVRSVTRTAFTLELVGMLLLATYWVPRDGLSRGMYISVFHSVSAFCNAGFSLYSESLCAFRRSVLINVTILALLITGGLGFSVLRDLKRVFLMRFRRASPPPAGLRFQSRLVLAVTLGLFLFSFPLYLVLERNYSLAGLGPLEAAGAAFFQVATPRTAGFNTVDIGAVGPAAMLLLIFLMFIGASPGSTGGGVKTTSLGVVLGIIRAALREHRHVNLFKRTIPTYVARKVIALIAMALGVIFIASLILLFTERPENFDLSRQGFFSQMVFEVVSAFGTVGLSTGVTPRLSGIGRLVITVVMFIGRIGPLTLGLAMLRARTAPASYRYTDARIVIG